jgi:hypothetical protein
MPPHIFAPCWPLVDLLLNSEHLLSLGADSHNTLNRNYLDVLSFRDWIAYAQGFFLRQWCYNNGNQFKN